MVQWMSMLMRMGRTASQAGILLVLGLFAGSVAVSVQAQTGSEDDGSGKPAMQGQMPMQGPMQMGHGRLKFYMDDGRSKTGRQAERAHYTVPADITLVDQDGRPVHLAALLAEPHPVVMQFIFTSCATICPVLSAGIASAQAELVRRAPDVRILSISIDPTYDTPARLKAYAARYHANANWRFLTGPEPMIRRTIAAFDALLRSDNKMYHRPYTYFRGRKGDWLRVDKLLSRNELLEQFEKVLAPTSVGAGGGVTSAGGR
ncbi:MAG: SCO family protein [Alphaproteobacteria bacterium]|nr:MAG: SCO family protein [Alphaproteobacteria bacterium]